VIEGELTFQRGVELIEAGPGTCVFLPRGIQHGFALRSEAARMLVMTTPAGLETAFRAFSAPANGTNGAVALDGPPDPEAMAAYEAEFAARGVSFVGPPLPALLAQGAFA
jgi:hypothetical protein